MRVTVDWRIRNVTNRNPLRRLYLLFTQNEAFWPRNVDNIRAWLTSHWAMKLTVDYWFVVGNAFSLLRVNFMIDVANEGWPAELALCYVSSNFSNRDEHEKNFFSLNLKCSFPLRWLIKEVHRVCRVWFRPDFCEWFIGVDDTCGFFAFLSFSGSSSNETVHRSSIS